MEIIKSNLKFKGNLSGGNKPVKIILHHAEAKNCTIEDIHNWHLARGWAGCGYHFFVRKDGRIFEGRPIWAVGAHCPAANSCSIGICAEGSYMSETMPLVQRNAIIELCKYLIEQNSNIVEIAPHKKYTSTSCPGVNYPLTEIVQAVFQKETKEDKNKEILDRLHFSSVKELQSVLGVASDGIIGPITNRAIEEVLSKPFVKIGSANKVAVRYIQFRIGAGIDGDFGPDTLKKVKEFQGKYGLVADGLVGNNTWAKLI